MTLIQITNKHKSEVINIEDVCDHLEKLLISPSFDPYSNQIVAQAITLLECFGETLSNNSVNYAKAQKS
jgi:hypothetical protein